MVWTDDFLQISDVLESEICKPGAGCLSSIEMRLSWVDVWLSICISVSKFLNLGCRD
jgi:hypothetical protein